MIILTPEAAEFIKASFRLAINNCYLELDIHKKDCDEFGCYLCLRKAPSKDDIVIEKHGIKILISPDCIELARGIRIDIGKDGWGLNINGPKITPKQNSI